MAERISDASKDVFWCLLCFAFVLLFSFLGILHKKCHKERECGWSISKKLFDHFFFQGDFVHDDSTWVTGTYKKVRWVPIVFFFLIKCQPVIAQYLFFGELSAVFPDFQSRERLIWRERREGLVFLRKEVVRFLRLLPLNHHFFPKK